MSDEKIILTPEEAESLFPDGKYIHNFANPGGMLIGCDYERPNAIKALREAKQIELGGDACKSMKHPIVVWDDERHYTFFEADMAKVEALEASRGAR